MKYMPAIFIHDELWNENYCALNVSKNDVLEILMSVLEEHCERYKDLLRTLRGMNDLLVSKQEPRKSIIVLKSMGRIVLGVAVGVLIAYFGF